MAYVPAANLGTLILTGDKDPGAYGSKVLPGDDTTTPGNKTTTTIDTASGGNGTASGTSANNTATPSVIPEVSLPDLSAGKQEAIDSVRNAYAEAGSGILDKAQNAYNVNYSTPNIPDSNKPKVGSSYVTPESTVKNQLEMLLSSDSDYIKRAKANAREGAQRAGILSSSMAEGAAVGAAIDRALPIAQQDAQTYSKAQQIQQGADVNQSQAAVEGLVSGALNSQKYELLDRSAALQSTFDIAMKSADSESSIALQELKGQWDFALKDSIDRLEFYLQKDLNEQSLDGNKASDIRTASADLIKSNQIAIENLLKDPDILQLGAQTYGVLIQNMITMTTKGIQFVYDSAGIDMDGYIEDLLNDYEQSGVDWADVPEPISTDTTGE